jgi:hypothetical protein
MHSKGPNVSLLSFGGVRKEFLGFFYSNMFSSKFSNTSPNSQFAPQDVTNSTTFLLPHMLWPKLNFHVCKL